jgi:hypothetical protein
MVQIHSPRPFFRQMPLDYALDFGSGLRRPLDASSSNPFAPTISLLCAEFTSAPLFFW